MHSEVREAILSDMFGNHEQNENTYINLDEAGFHYDGETKVSRVSHRERRLEQLGTIWLKAEKNDSDRKAYHNFVHTSIKIFQRAA